MNDLLKDLRAEFSIFVVEGDLVDTNAVETLAKTFGYASIQTFTTPASALAAARKEAPHIVLFDFERFEEQAALALTEFTSISEEILVVLMINFSQTMASLEIVSRGLAFDSITRPFIAELELQQKIDRAAQRLYFQFESEQLRESMEANTYYGNLGGLGTEAEAKAPEPIAAPASEPVVEPPPLEPDPHPVVSANESIVNDFLSRIAQTRDLDETLDIFLSAMASEANGPVVYLKYLPSHASLLIAQTSGVEIEKYRGLGIDFRKEGIADAGELLRDPSDVKALGELIRSLFQKDSFIAIPHLNDGDVAGVFCVLGDVEVSNSESRALALLGIFELAWKRNLTMREKHTLDILDPTTGAFNRRQFIQKLDEEISRARRILLPVSVATIDVDGFKKLNEKLGSQQADSVLKAIASVLKKTTRVSDLVFRTGADEFTVILPHTPGMGAAIKAERIRRVIEAMKFPLLASPITASIGVSEYPSISADGEALVRNADEALTQVRAAGGNKVCLATAVAGHNPDFVPREVPAGGFGPPRSEPQGGGSL